MSTHYRLAQPRDMAFVRESWLASFRDAAAAGVIPMPHYRRVYLEAIDWVLARPGVEVWVAFDPGETDPEMDLFGWLCLERGGLKVSCRRRVKGRWRSALEPLNVPLVHYVFTKQPYRRLGIARGLFAAAHVNPTSRWLYSFKTAAVAELRDKIPLAMWSPMTARHPKEPV